MLNPLDLDEIKRKVEKKEKKKNGKIKETTRRAIRIYNILKRDKFRCVFCGNKENLTIDHINGRKFAKHNNTQKYKIDVCRTLCVRCHMELNLSQDNEDKDL